jgi:importin subunit alpha-1
MDQQADFRRNTYKERSRFKPEEVRRRRENMQVEIRKQKKEENLAKRRNFNETTSLEDSDDDLDTLNQEAQVRTYIHIYTPISYMPILTNL